MNKNCKKCGALKPLEEFHKAPNCFDGRRGECKKCTNALSVARYNTPKGKALKAAVYAKNKDKWNARRSSPEGLRRYRLKVQRTPSYVLSFSLYRALKRRPSHDPVTHPELMQIYANQSGLCALSGLKMTWMRGRITHTSISIDRIDSAKGYERNNVRLVCHAANRMKGDATDAETLTMAKAIVANMDKSEEPTFTPADAPRIREMLADPAMVETLGPYIVTKYQAALAGMVVH